MLHIQYLFWHFRAVSVILKKITFILLKIYTMKKNIFLLLIIFLTIPVFSQTKEQLDLLDQYYQKVLNEWHIPGMAVAITNGEKIIFS